ncbi:hypothetical protein BDV12DRAFT_161699 [Aspergillus spectabilis]
MTYPHLRSLLTRTRQIFVRPPPPHDMSRKNISSNQNPYPPFVSLPVDILLLITPLLPLSSQACLALTCKPLYSLFGDILKDERLSWPRLLATKSYDTILGNPNSPRTRLLHQLQDERFRYCASCLKLHPGGVCVNKPPPLSFKRENVVDLCPCLALTFGDRLRLGEWLDTGVPSMRLPPRIHAAFRLSVTRRSAEPCLIHECSMTGHADVLVNLAMTVTTHNDSTRCLIVQTKYHLQWKKKPPITPLDPDFPQAFHFNYNDNSKHMEYEPIFICPHTNIFELYFNHYKWPYGRCYACKATTSIEKHYSDDDTSPPTPPYFTVEGVRDLGGLDHERWSPWFFNSRCETDNDHRWWYALNAMTQSPPLGVEEEPLHSESDSDIDSAGLRRRLDCLKHNFENLFALRRSFPPLHA